MEEEEKNKYVRSFRLSLLFYIYVYFTILILCDYLITQMYTLCCYLDVKSLFCVLNMLLNVDTNGAVLYKGDNFCLVRAKYSSSNAVV